MAACRLAEGNVPIGDALDAFLAVDDKRGCQHLQDRQCNRIGPGHVTLGHICQHHGEFIPPQPGNRICLSHTAADPLPGLDQQPVSTIVAKGIVDVFEVINVQNDGRKRLLLFDAFEQRLLTKMDRAGTIQNLSQAVFTCFIVEKVNRSVNGLGLSKTAIVSNHHASCSTRRMLQSI